MLAASRIAGAGFLQSCKHSIRLSIVGYLLPFAMALTPALLGFPDRVGAAGWAAIGMLVLASVAGGASMYGYFLRPLDPFTRLVHGAAAIAGLGFVFNHEPAMLALFFGLMAIGVGKPMFDNHRERRAAAGG